MIVSRYHVTQPSYDWVDPEFGQGFGVYVLLTVGFQINYLFLYVYLPLTNGNSDTSLGL